MASMFSRMRHALFEVKAPVTQPTPGFSDTVRKASRGSGSFTLTPTVASAMAATYTAAVKNRDEYFKEAEKVKQFYLVDTLLCNVSEDALTPDISSGEILRITSNNSTIKKELEKFQKEFSIDNIIADFIFDLLFAGEYALRPVVEKGKGIVDIVDDIKPNTVIGFYKQGYPYKYMIRDDDKIALKSPSDIVHFMLQGRKIKVPTFQGLTKEQYDKLPKEVKELPNYIRLGRPLLYGVVSKVKELDLLEKLVPAIKLADMAAGSIVGVDVPPSTDPKEAFNIAREYENLFNKKVAVDDGGMLSASEILTQAGRVKVIPTFQGKGGMQNVDVRTPNSVNDIMATIRDVREVICTAIGFPVELLYGGASRSEMIKKYARYLRKIKSIQTSIADGVLQMAMIHLKNIEATSSVTLADLEVEFMNETVNIDELEKLEYHDATVGLLRNTVTFLKELGEAGFADVVSEEKLKAFLANKFDFIEYEAETAGYTPKPKPSKKLAKPSRGLGSPDIMGDPSE